MAATTDPAPSLPSRQQLEPGLIRISAANPSPMTQTGTNTYLLGHSDIAVIDPGPLLPAHLDAILAAVPPGGRISHILVTHAHLDHSALAPALARQTGAPVLAFGDAAAGRSPTMQTLAGSPDNLGGEGVDFGFQPDRTLTDGETLLGSDWQIDAIWTPGHFSGHLSFAWGDRLFTGDHVMGWASSLISPPDGDLAAYMRSLRRLQQRHDSVFYPGHGAPVTAPAERLDWLTRHRLDRGAAVIAALTNRYRSITSLTDQVYHDTPTALRAAAARNLFAHLIDLTERNLATPDRTLSFTARYKRAGTP